MQDSWHRVRLKFRPDGGREVASLSSEAAAIARAIFSPANLPTTEIAWYVRNDEEGNPIVYFTPGARRVAEALPEKWNVETCEAPSTAPPLLFLAGVQGPPHPAPDGSQ